MLRPTRGAGGGALWKRKEKRNHTQRSANWGGWLCGASKRQARWKSARFKRGRSGSTCPRSSARRACLSTGTTRTPGMPRTRRRTRMYRRSCKSSGARRRWSPRPPGTVGWARTDARSPHTPLRQFLCLSARRSVRSCRGQGRAASTLLLRRRRRPMAAGLLRRRTLAVGGTLSTCNTACSRRATRTAQDGTG